MTKSKYVEVISVESHHRRSELPQIKYASRQKIRQILRVPANPPKHWSQILTGLQIVADDYIAFAAAVKDNPKPAEKREQCQSVADAFKAAERTLGTSAISWWGAVLPEQSAAWSAKRLNFLISEMAALRDCMSMAAEIFKKRTKPITGGPIRLLASYAAQLLFDRDGKWPKHREHYQLAGEIFFSIEGFRKGPGLKDICKEVLLILKG